MVPIFANNRWAVKQQWWSSVDASRKLSYTRSSSTPPCVHHLSQQTVDSGTVAGPAEQKQAVCDGFLPSALSASIPRYAKQKMLQWLQQNLKDLA